MYILALDDERYALDAIAQELEKVFPGAVIHEETKASSAITWAEELVQKGEQLSYAFCDIQMRGTNGIEVARQLKKIHPKVILFFCTAYSEYAFDAFGLHAKGYLLKPACAKEIENILDEMVEDWRTQVMPLERNLKIQTFGHFEVFLDGVPLSFEREKAKELFA